MNRLAKIENNKIVYSDSVNNIIIGDRRIFNPSEEQFREAGFDDLPTIEHDPEDTVYYVIEDGVIVAKVHKYVKPATKYSKLKIIENVEKAGFNWSDIETWMQSVGLYSKWLVAQELSDDYPGFNQIIDLVKQQFPTANVDEILQDSILR